MMIGYRPSLSEAQFQALQLVGGHDVSLPGQLGGWSVMLRHGLRKIDYFTISSAV